MCVCVYACVHSRVCVCVFTITCMCVCLCISLLLCVCVLVCCWFVFFFCCILYIDVQGPLLYLVSVEFQQYVIASNSLRKVNTLHNISFCLVIAKE